MEPGLQGLWLVVSSQMPVLVFTCLPPSVSVSNLSLFSLEESTYNNYLGFGAHLRPKRSHFKNLDLILPAKAIASPKVPCTGSRNMWFRDRVRPSR